MLQKIILLITNLFVVSMLQSCPETPLTFVLTLFLFTILNYIWVFRLLKSYNTLFTITIGASDLVLTKWLIHRYYKPDYKLHEDYYLALVIVLVLIVFSFTTKDSLKELDSGFSSLLLSEALSVAYVYKYFFYFKILHPTVEQVKSLTFAEFDTRCFYFFVDFAVLNAGAIFALLLKLVCSVRNKQVYLKQIISLYLKAIAATVLYNLVNNRHLAESVYGLLGKYVPQPYNVLLYNSVPSDVDSLFRYGLAGIFTFFM